MSQVINCGHETVTCYCHKYTHKRIGKFPQNTNSYSHGQAKTYYLEIILVLSNDFKVPQASFWSGDFTECTFYSFIAKLEWWRNDSAMHGYYISRHLFVLYDVRCN
jgi:hypothetical protein